MKDVRFYLEFPSVTAKRKSGKANAGHSGNVSAVIQANTFWRDGRFLREAVSGVFEWPNSGVAGTAVSCEFLRQCKRIPERTAREIHPLLFETLDRSDS